MISKKYGYLMFLFLWGCQSSVVRYKISDKYVGPCVVFVVPENKLKKDGKNIIVKNGLGVTFDVKMRNEFVFESFEKEAEVKIIEIGKEKEANDYERYIFGLVKGTRGSNCINSEINLVSFFIGTRAQFENWNSNDRDELKYFDSTGRDWCSYYKKALENGEVPQ